MILTVLLKKYIFVCNCTNNIETSHVFDHIIKIEFIIYRIYIYISYEFDIRRNKIIPIYVIILINDFDNNQYMIKYVLLFEIINIFPFEFNFIFIAFYKF